MHSDMSLRTVCELYGQSGTPVPTDGRFTYPRTVGDAGPYGRTVYMFADSRDACPYGQTVYISEDRRGRLFGVHRAKWVTPERVTGGDAGGSSISRHDTGGRVI